MILTDKEIKETGIFGPEPIQAESRPGLISFGLSSMGYDLRLGSTIKRLRPDAGVLDPKRSHAWQWEKLQLNGPFPLPPLTCILGYSLERFSVPQDCLCLFLNKSTYARCFSITHVTPAEPEWTGHLTLEITNLAPVPVLLYPSEGIGQVCFFRASSRPARTYKDRKGKYNNAPAEPASAL